MTLSLISARNILFSGLCLTLFVAYGCSADQPKPDPGRCFTNMDCPKGHKCNDTRCEDIYHPRHKIKIN